MASIWVLPESKPTTVTSLPVSCEPWTIPEAAASFEPYMPTMSSLAWMMALEVSAALVTSPAICSSRSFRSAGALALKYSLKPSQRCLPVVEVESWQTMPTEPDLPLSSSIMCCAASSAALVLFV